MTSVTAVAWIAAPRERVWAILTDLAGFPSWNPLFPRATGALRSGDRLALSVSCAVASEQDRAIDALVLEVRRRRGMVWLLRAPIAPTCNPRDTPLAPCYYRVTLDDLADPTVPEHIGEPGARVVQQLASVEPLGVWLADEAVLQDRLDALNDALRTRAAAPVDDVPVPGRPVAGAIRVRSRRGRWPRDPARRPGLLAGLSELLPRWPRTLAA